MRNCGNCGWPGEGLCYAWGHCHGHNRDWPACALWKPEQDWRKETCGTCEFRLGGECYRHGGDMKHEAQQSWRACAEWMPALDEEG